MFNGKSFIIPAIIIFDIALLNIPVLSGNSSKDAPAPAEEENLAVNLQPVKPVPQGSIITDSPGEIVGYTYYELQSTGSSGNRIAVDGYGGVHFVWMNALSYPSPRTVYYNYKGGDGAWLAPGTGVEVSPTSSNSGFGQLSVFQDSLAAISLHWWAPIADLKFLLDSNSGAGTFALYDPPDYLEYYYAWPYLAIDRNDRIHIVATENPPSYYGRDIGYTCSTDGGSTWSSLAVVDTAHTLSVMITASRVSDKVAIVYCHPYTDNTQWLNDIYYVESSDGLTWDFTNGKTDITGYTLDQDSLNAYTDCDAIYDFNDNLHIIWNARWATLSTTYNKTFLFHYDVNSGTINEIASSPSNPVSGCNTGGWNLRIAKMSIATGGQSGGLFVTYTGWDSLDCSQAGYSNGDIYLQYSSDDGQTWSAPENLTNSQTPGCSAGNCDSDNWSSLGEVADSMLYLTYINDKDAGASVYSEGTATYNPVMYLAIPNPLIGLCEYVTGDINSSGNYNGLDITYGVSYFKGDLTPPYKCTCTYGNRWYVAGDVNASCSYNGLDITYGVNYFKMIGPDPQPCPDCPPE